MTISNFEKNFGNLLLFKGLAMKNLFYVNICADFTH